MLMFLPSLSIDLYSSSLREPLALLMYVVFVLIQKDFSCFSIVSKRMCYTIFFCDAKVDHRTKRSFLTWSGSTSHQMENLLHLHVCFRRVHESRYSFCEQVASLASVSFRFRKTSKT